MSEKLITQSNESISGFFGFTLYCFIGIAIVSLVVFIILSGKNIEKNQDKKQSFWQIVSAVVAVLSFFFALFDFYANGGVDFFFRSKKIPTSTTTSDTVITNVATTTTTSSGKSPFAQLLSMSVGFKYTYGRYAGKEIEWRILDKKTDRVLLLSEYNLEQIQFNDSGSSLWRDSSLRLWLNNEFINGVFSSDEISYIITSHLITHVNNDYDDSTEDKIFVLSKRELQTYFSTNKSRIADTYPEAFARSKCHQYWLRDRGDDDFRALIVMSDGTLRKGGSPVTNQFVNVRPAMWVQI